MSKDAIASLRGEIEQLERTLSGSAKKASGDRKRVSARKQVLAEIESLEKRLGGLYMDEPELPACDGMGPPAMDDDFGGMGPAMDEGDLDDDLMGDEAAELPLVGSVEEAGIEDEITQDRFTEVEEEEHGKELTTAPTTLDLEKPGSDLVRWKRASARLDRVAAYLEKHNELRLALRIDQISDAIDAAVNEKEGA
jgi:hypothetical protein